MDRDFQIAMLWMRGSLSFLEQLCVQSFLDAGHHVVLYSYEPIGHVPDGVELRDAGEILPEEGLHTEVLPVPEVADKTTNFPLLIRYFAPVL